jgi:hypothetical protein
VPVPAVRDSFPRPDALSILTGAAIGNDAVVVAEAVRFAVPGGTPDVAELVGLVDGPADERVCRGLGREGWPERSHPESPAWHAGPRARRLGCEEALAFRAGNCEC